MASKYESVKNIWKPSPFGNDPSIPSGEIGLGGAVLVKVPKRKSNHEHSTENLHRGDNIFDTSGLTAEEREYVIWKKRNMHWDPKKSHWDTYIPPDEVPDLAYEDNRPIKQLKENAYNLTDSQELWKS